MGCPFITALGTKQGSSELMGRPKVQVTSENWLLKLARVGVDSLQGLLTPITHLVLSFEEPLVFVGVF